MDNSSQTVYLEIRGGTGGDEAKTWASDLYRMYMRFAVKNNWKTTPVDEGVLKITGSGVFDTLKHESGVHRVQRVPQSEKRGRIHTSTATVVALPEVAESEVNINPADLDWQFIRAGGHGGQNVNKVSSAVRLTHKPSGLSVHSREERHQEQNRVIALSLIRSKLWELQEVEKEKTIAGYRSSIGRGMRSEKIRTYNFPQNRIKDHRINKSWHNLEQVMEGNFEKIAGELKKI
ncbi:PCRF domain-containing protein [Candidatus Microgenomates bacterium]|nr:PCRF domain-containing protein [Candidatus Microgenomates bacterium]